MDKKLHGSFQQERKRLVEQGSWVACEVQDGDELVRRGCCISPSFAVPRKSPTEARIIADMRRIRAWKPYIAKFKDFQNKTVSRPILRPKVLSVAFTLLNRVDIHNQGRCVNSS
eukprot:COSAG01_NODE_31108_length_603_cov_3.549603_2_plen_113_part_01